LLGHARAGKDPPMWGGGHRWCMVTIASPSVVSRAHERPVRLVKRHLRLTSGPRLYFVISKIFNHPNFQIRNGNLPDVQNTPNFVGIHFEKYGTTLLFGPTRSSLRISSYKFWNKFKFESSLNFKGVQTFLEKSDTFSKIPSLHDILEYEFRLTRLYPNIEGFFTSRKGT
jgi:hypothetical protein